MKRKLVGILEDFNFPIFLQGSLDENQPYPDHFFTFWNNSTDESSHYDDKANNYIWDFNIYFYSISSTQTNEILLELKEKLEKAGAIVPGKGFDVASDEPTHTGRGINAQFIE